MAKTLLWNCPPKPAVMMGGCRLRSFNLLACLLTLGKGFNRKRGVVNVLPGLEMLGWKGDTVGNVVLPGKEHNQAIQPQGASRCLSQPCEGLEKGLR